MKISVTIALSLIFLLLGILHICWAFGDKKSFAAAIPTTTNGKPVLNPGLWDCLFVAIVLLCFSSFVLIKGDILPVKLPAWLLNYGLYIIGGLFFLRAVGDFKYVGFFKKIKATRFGQMDTRYYSPLCLLIAILSLLLTFVN